MKIRISSVLDIGKRDNNEDALAYCEDLSQQHWSQDGMDAYIPLGEYGAIAVVADGMGGAKAGEVASAIAIQKVKEMLSTERAAVAVEAGDDAIRSLLEETIKCGDAAILEHIANHDDTRGMGTTIVICWITDSKAYIAWCGDSRCYCYHPVRGLRPLTRDHSLVQELVDKGDISPEEAFSHPDSNIITKGLGDFGCDVQPDVIVCPIKTGETLLLCSDGLCGYCQGKDIQAILDAGYTDIKKSCHNLLQLTLDAGGYDNVAIIAMSLINDNQQAPPPLSFIQTIKRSIRRL